MRYLKNPGKSLRHLLSAFFIYPLILPVMFLDLCAEIYHRVCFPIYKISYIRRREYIKIDRHKLESLSAFQKVNCVFCGYINGALHYFSKIAAKSEEYWCEIQHQKDPNFKAPKHHKDFIEFEDEKELKEFGSKSVKRINKK